MKRILSLTLCTMLAPLSFVTGAEVPENVEYLDGTHVFIKNPKWHEKEGGNWLFTCRLEASADRLVKPVAHLHLFHLKETDEGEEITWEHKAIVRRNEFDKSSGSRRANFVRVFVDDLPEALDSLTVEFKNEPPEDD